MKYVKTMYDDSGLHHDLFAPAKGSVEELLFNALLEKCKHWQRELGLRKKKISDVIGDFLYNADKAYLAYEYVDDGKYNGQVFLIAISESFVHSIQLDGDSINRPMLSITGGKNNGFYFRRKSSMVGKEI